MTATTASETSLFKRILDGRWQWPNRAALWQLGQNVGYTLIGLGITGTLIYLAFNIFPKFGPELEGSNVFPGRATLNSVILHIHIVTALPPLILGFFAFSSRLRRLSPRSHRWIGTIYCVGIWISATSGLMLATANKHGIFAQLGFSTLAVVWFTTTYVAYKTARAKQFPTHRAWMIRSFAITLAVVSVRPMFIMDPPFGLEYSNWYQIVTWLCWVPNLIIAEIYIRTTHFNGRLKGWTGQTAYAGSAAASRA